MKLTWTAPAADDLQEFVDFIARDKPDAAAKFAQRVVDRLDALASFPLTGRKGTTKGTYEVLLTPYPYVAIYRVFDDEMRVIRIRHSAQAEAASGSPVAQRRSRNRTPARRYPKASALGLSPPPLQTRS